MTTRPLILLALLVGCCPPTPPPHVCVEINQRTFTVERIVDGDTFKVTYDGEPTSVRITGIDAPEAARDASTDPAAQPFIGLSRPLRLLGLLSLVITRQFVVVYQPHVLAVRAELAGQDKSLLDHVGQRRSDGVDGHSGSVGKSFDASRLREPSQGIEQGHACLRGPSHAPRPAILRCLL